MNSPDFLCQDTLGSIRLTGHRIGLFHVVEDYNDGYTAEMLAEQFPTLPLSLIYKVLAFYLENRAEVDAAVAEGRAEIDRHRASAPKGPSLAELRRRKAEKRSVPQPGAQ
jgi:uncharacterized protein (DUF433 family)